MQKILSYHLHREVPVRTVIECACSDGIGIHIIGLASQETKESLLRTVTSLQNEGFRFPGRKTVINIAPEARTGTEAFDLPIALVTLMESGQLLPEELPFGTLAAIGELGLNGKIRPVRNVAALVQVALADGVKHVIIPAANITDKTDPLLEDKRIVPVRTLTEAKTFIESFRGV